jgi:hypothetical protein
MSKRGGGADDVADVVDVAVEDLIPVACKNGCMVGKGDAEGKGVKAWCLGVTSNAMGSAIESTPKPMSVSTAFSSSSSSMEMIGGIEEVVVVVEEIEDEEVDEEVEEDEEEEEVEKEEWCDIVRDPMMFLSVILFFLRWRFTAAACTAFFSLHRCGVFIRFA